MQQGVRRSPRAPPEPLEVSEPAPAFGEESDRRGSGPAPWTTPLDVPGNTRERSCMARRRRSFSALAGPGVGNGRQDSERAYPFELPLYARIGPEADRPRDSRYTPIVSP